MRLFRPDQGSYTAEAGTLSAGMTLSAEKTGSGYAAWGLGGGAELQAARNSTVTRTGARNRIDFIGAPPASGPARVCDER